MKPITPHDPRDESLDDLIAAALHGELTPEERTQFESRLQTDPAAQAAYQEAQAMHDLLEKTHSSAQPNSDFEQRMVSGVRRKMQTENNRETAWGSVVALWAGVRSFFGRKRRPVVPAIGTVLTVLLVLFILAGVALGPITNGIKQAPHNAAMQEARQMAQEDYQAQVDSGVPNPEMKDLHQFLPQLKAQKLAQNDQQGADAAQWLIDHPSQMAFGGSQVKSVFTTITSQLAMAGTAGSPAPADFGRLSITRTEPPLVDKLKSLNSPTPAKQAHDEARLAGLEKIELHYKDQLQADPANTEVAQQLQRVVHLRQGFEKKVEQDADSSGTPIALGAPNSYNGGTTVTGGSLDRNGYAPEATAAAPRAQPAFAVTFPDSAPADAPAAPATTTTPPPPKPNFDANAIIAQADGLKDAQAQLSKHAGDNSAQPGSSVDTSTPVVPAAPASTPPAVDERKLIRNAQLDLEVKDYQAAMDQITAQTRAAGGYVDTSNSQKGGNGKLQGTVVVKVLPQNLDAFLLKLRDLGQVQNQSISTDDVTKDYFDTQARLVNSQKMETQLQDLLKHENSKVADLLAVERELARVRGDIEQMQGQLKLYDFEVQYATITIQLREKDLNQAAAYLLKEQDDFSLFATDVEATFQKARQTADDFKAQVLTANLNHNSGSDVSAELLVMVAPDQVDAFLSEVRGLGRVANFTRQTQRVAKDGGDSEQPADQTLTEKDKVQVHLTIRSDDETRKQVALTVVAKAVDDALDQAKAAAQANAGVEILSSSLNKTPQGASTAQLSLRVPGKDYTALIAAFNALGRTASLSIQRNDDSGPGANGDDAPVIMSLSLTDDDTPLQETNMTVRADDVDGESQQIKKDAATAGVGVKASSFERQPDGTEQAQLTFRMPMAKYSTFLEKLNQLGKVESLTVHRDDRPDQTVADDTAPAEITLQLHNERDIVPENTGLLATLRDTFGAGMDALLGSVRVIGVVLAFLTPWVFTLALLAWVGRRIYVWRNK